MYVTTPLVYDEPIVAWIDALCELSRTGNRSWG
jgi:hypothetical protein